MLHYLGQFADQIPGFNVFRYTTFRTGAATMTALFFVFMFGPALIRPDAHQAGQRATDPR